MARAAWSLNALLAQLDGAFPSRSRLSDGWIGDTAHAARASDHNPDVNGVVHARDYTHDPAHGVNISRLSDELAASRDGRIKYIIANGYILDSRPGNRPWQWIKYTGTNPHTKHLHLSVFPGSGDDPRPWNLPMFREDDDMPTPAEFWGHPLRDPFVTNEKAPGAYKPAGVLAAWAPTHAARALAAAAAAQATSAEILRHVAADKDVDPDVLIAQIETVVKQAITDAVVSVDIDVHGVPDGTE